MTSPYSHPNLALKLMIVGRRKPGTTLAQHRQHIRHVHGEAVLRYVAAEPTVAPQRYVQHRVFDGSYRGTPVAGGAPDPFALNRDFVTQIWFADVQALAQSRETAFYREQLQGDEDNFVDQATVVFMPVRERLVTAAGVAPAPTAAGGVKLFGFLQCVPGADPAAFAAAWADMAGAAVTTTGALRHVQNTVLARPGLTPPLHGIDEFWLTDEAAAHALLARWQQAVHDTLVQPGLVAAGSAFALLAHEDVLHPGPEA